MLNVNLWSTLFLGAGKEHPAKTTATAPRDHPGTDTLWEETLRQAPKRGLEHFLQIPLCFVLGFFFFVYKKSGLFSVALLMPTRGHRFMQSAAAQRLLTCEKSG